MPPKPRFDAFKQRTFGFGLKLLPEPIDASADTATRTALCTLMIVDGTDIFLGSSILFFDHSTELAAKSTWVSVSTILILNNT